MSKLVEIAKGIGKYELGINELKNIYTNRNLQSAVNNGVDLLFRYGLLAGEGAILATANHRTGLENLDILARTPMWNMGIDYKCGTGHGVGFVGAIHEAPNGFRWRIVPERFDSAVLEEGMVTTNEPGIYIEGSHGIRIENELVVRKTDKNEYGQFMEFEVVTFAPIDLDAVNIDEMNKEEKAYLNYYHKLVYDKISPFLNDEEKQWLEVYTREV